MRVSASFTPTATNTLTVTPRVGGSVALRVVTVPVQIGSAVGQVVADSDAYLRARLPAAQVTRVDHAPMVSARVTTLPTTSDEWSTAFSRILGEVDDLHLLENASSRTLYFGFIPEAKLRPGRHGLIGPATRRWPSICPTARAPCARRCCTRSGTT